MSALNIIAIIPIRGEDKEFKNGGMPIIGGKPLISYTIESAKESELIDRIIVSTDSQDIANVAREYGAEIPFIRPKELSDKDVGIVPVLKHCVLWLEKNENYLTDIVVLMEVTHPIRERGLIDRVLKTLLEEELDSVFVAHEERHDFWIANEFGELEMLSVEGNQPRHLKKPIYREMGGIACATKAQFIKEGKRIGGRVGLIPLRDISAIVDTHDEQGLLLVEKIMEIKGIGFNS